MGRTISHLAGFDQNVLGFRSLVAQLAPFERVGTKRANFFGNGKCGLIANVSATMVNILRRERREV